MSLFHPTIMLRRVTEITGSMLDKMKIRALILDLDNTLTTHNNPDPDPEVLLWLDRMRDADIRLVLVSNNSGERVLPFAEALGLAYTANARKPLTKGFRETAEKLKLDPKQIGVVGDQIFTDVLGGNLFGSPTILVEPMEPETGWLFRFKRKLEAPIIRRFREKRSKSK